MIKLSAKSRLACLFDSFSGELGLNFYCAQKWELKIGQFFNYSGKISSFLIVENANYSRLIVSSFFALMKKSSKSSENAHPSFIVSFLFSDIGQLNNSISKKKKQCRIVGSAKFSGVCWRFGSVTKKRTCEENNLRSREEHIFYFQ